MSKLYHPKIFNDYPEIVAVFRGKDKSLPLDGSIMARTDVPEIEANKAALAKELGFKTMALPKLEHGAVIHQIKAEPYEPVTADGLTTDQAGVLIGVAMADCLALLIYDPNHHAVMAIHSGWRGSKANIAGQGVAKLTTIYQSNPKDLLVYIGPGACSKCYEVEDDVYVQFDPKYFTKKNEVKWLFDNTAVVRDQLAEAGVKSDHIEVDSRCTMEHPELFSARRDQLPTGRNIAVIGLKS